MGRTTRPRRQSPEPRSAGAPATAAQLRAQSTSNCDGGRDHLQGEGFLRSQQLRPAEQAKEQAVAPRCLCLYHEQAVEKYEHKRGAHHEGLGKMADRLRDHVRGKSVDEAPGERGQRGSPAAERHVGKCRAERGAAVIKML